MTHVTEITDYFLERPLVDWMLRDPKKAKQVSEEALKIGRLVEQWIQNDLRHQTPQTGSLSSLTIPVNQCLAAWYKFKDEHPEFVPSVVGMQQELRRSSIVGHPDFFLKRRDQRGLCDLKCASQIRPVNWTQVAAYSWLAWPDDVDFLAILRLDKVTGSYEYVELTDSNQLACDVQVWLCYKQLYEHRQRVTERSRARKEAENLREYLP